jgi:hypothetical protein
LTAYRQKLIEVALPLEAIDDAQIPNAGRDAVAAATIRQSRNMQKAGSSSLPAPAPSHRSDWGGLFDYTNYSTQSKDLLRTSAQRRAQVSTYYAWQ